VLHALLPGTSVDCPIVPRHFALAVSVVERILTSVHIAVLPVENAVTVLKVVQKLTLVLVASELRTLLPLARAMLESIFKMPDKRCPVRPLVAAEPIRFSVSVEAGINVAAFKDVGALTVLE